MDSSFRANWLFEIIAALCSHYSWTQHYVKQLIYADAYDFFEIAQREKEMEYKNKVRNSLIVRHAIENMMTEKPTPLDEYFKAYGVGFDSGIKDDRTAEQIMADIDAAFENLD